MGLFSDPKKFEKIKRTIQQNQTRTAGDSRVINFLPDKTYKFRLLFWENPENPDRVGPFIEMYKHTAQSSDQRWHSVVCPTSFNPQTGFQDCPICTNNNALWNSGLESDKKIASKFKRKFCGYALIFVVNDPVNPENNGHVKIWRYTIQQKRWLDRKLFGIAGRDEDEVDNDDIIGRQAFLLDDGYDIKVSTSKKGQWIDFDLEFARNSSSVSVEPKILEEEIENLNFDSFMQKSDSKTLQDFFDNYILGVVESEDETITSGADVVIGKSDKKENAKPSTAENVQKAAEKALESIDDSSDDSSESEINDEGGVDIDSMLAQIKAEIEGI